MKLGIYSKAVYWVCLFSLFGVAAGLPAEPARQSGSMAFAVIGDYGVAGPAEEAVANLVKSWNPAFIVTLGDNNMPNGAAYSLEDNIGRYYSDYIFRYRGKYGAGSETRRFFPALGNHDWHQGSANPYLNYFNLPGNERYYDFVQGPVHFFILDSVEEEPDGNGPASGQAAWLRQALANSTSNFKVVVCHYPPYSSGKHGSVPFMQWPFKEWGADVVLSGHNHIYERLYVNGMTYIVNGLGGDYIGNFRSEILPESLVRYNGSHGALRAEATNDYLKFQFISIDNLLIDEYVLSASVPVATSISSASPKFSNAALMEFNVKFSEPVSGVDVSDFALAVNGLNGAYVSEVAGTGADYVARVNVGQGAGSLRLDLIDNDSITNFYGSPLGDAGFGSGSISSETYQVDTVPPVVSAITRMGTSPTRAESVDFAVTFSEPVSDVDVSDFSLSATNPAGGAYVSSVNGSGASYLVSAQTGGADNLLRLDASGGGVSDLFGNLLGASYSAGEAYAVDKTAPSVLSITRTSHNPSRADFVDFNVKFSEPVSGVDSSDFAISATGINGAYVANIGGGADAYVVTVNTGEGSGELRLDLLNDFSITDAVGIPLANAIGGETYTLDKTAPAVLSISRVGAEWTNAGSVEFSVTFSDPVLGVDVSDFVLSATGISGAYVSAVRGEGANYIVTAQTGTGDGTLRLDAIDDDSIVNLAENPLGAASPGNGNFTAGESYSFDRTPPVVTGILRASPNPSNAASVDFAVTFSEPVSGVDVSDFFLNTGDGAIISGLGGAGASYIVSVTTGARADSLRLDWSANGSAFDVAGNSASGNAYNGETYTINRIMPTVISIARLNESPSSASKVEFAVAFSEPVSGVDISDFKLTADGVRGASIAEVKGGGASYVVSVSTGIDNGSIRLDLADDNSIVNPVGNPLGGFGLGDGSFAAGETYEVSKFLATVKEIPVPALVSPSRGALLNALAPTLSWTKVPNAAYYETVVARDAEFKQIVAAAFVNENQWSVSLPGDGTYYWQARAYDSNLQAGRFSGAESFTVDSAPPPTPVPLTPKDNDRLSARWKFTWTNVGAARYEIQIDNNPDFSSPEWTSWRRDPSYPISAMRKGTYYWRVRAKDAAGNWSEWSAVFKLIVP